MKKTQIRSLLFCLPLKEAVFVFFVLISVAPDKGVCGGLFFPELDTQALGRGGAFTARADNPSAFYFNPAGLSKQPGISLLAGGNFISLNVSFLRAGTGQWIPIEVPEYPDLEIGYGNPDMDYSNGVDGVAHFSAVSQQTKAAFTGFELMANWGDAFRVKGLALSLGIFAPSSHNAPEYPEDGAQRYAIRSMHTTILYPGVGVSYSFCRYFQLGAVFLNGMAWIEKSQATRLSPTPQDIDFNEDLGGDGSVALKMKDLSMPTGIVGVLSNPLDWLEIGAAVKLPVQMAAKGTVKFTAPKVDYPNAELIPGYDGVTVSHHFPWIVSTGLRYIHERFDVEVDFVWENWGSYDGMDVDMSAKIDLEPDPANEEPVNVKEMPDSEIPKRFRDAYSVRLGGDVDILEDIITVRLGGFYQSSAYPKDNRTFSLDFPFGEQVGLSGGLTWHAFGYFDLNFGYSHIFQRDVNVEDGIVQQSGSPVELPDPENPEELIHVGIVQQSGSPVDLPDPENPEELIHVGIGNAVNNGRYQVDLNIFSVSVAGHFDI